MDILEGIQENTDSDSRVKMKDRIPKIITEQFYLGKDLDFYSTN